MTQRAARWLGFAIWAGVAASAVFWGLRLFATGPSLPPQAVAIAPQALSGGDVSRVLGAAPASAPATPVVPLAPASSRFALLGIVAPRGECPGCRIRPSSMTVHGGLAMSWSSIVT